MARLVTFTILFLFWVLLSGMFTPALLTLGVVSCLLVTYLSADLLFPGNEGLPRPRAILGMIGYLPWLFWQIVVANLQVTYIVLHPRMEQLIDPQLIRFRTRLRKPFSRVTFAQSITLTPGTISVSIDGDEFTVFALTEQAARSLPGEMERRVAAALESGE